MQIKFHILISIVFLCQWPSKVDTVKGSISPQLVFGFGRRVAANGGFKRAPAQNIRNGGQGHMPKPQVAPKVPKEMPVKNVPPPTNASLAKRAKDALKVRVYRLGEQIKYVKEKAKFGLDKMPAHGNEVVYIAESLTKTGKVDAEMMKRMLAYTGKTFYNGLWRASKAVQGLSFWPKTILWGMAVSLELVHTWDEYHQLTLLSRVAPDQVGTGMPKNLREFFTGLNNFWWDAWPDFAFSVPLVFFALNPPLGILIVAYKTLFEYCGKKVIGDLLKDYVWQSELGPVQNVNKFLAKKVSAAKVFPPEAGDNDYDENGEVTVEQALVDSQLDSNFYKYCAWNSIRSMIVLAVAIQQEFFTSIESAPDDKLTDLAIETKKKMSVQMVQDTKDIFQSEMVQKLVNWSNKPEEKMDPGKREQMLKEKAEKLEEEIKPLLDIFEKENPTMIEDKLNPAEISDEHKSRVLDTVQKMASKNGKLKETIDELKTEMNAEMDSEMKPMLLKMAKALAQRMAFKHVEATASSPEEESNNWAITMAHLISDASTPEGIMRTAMLDAINLQQKQRNLLEKHYEVPKVVEGKLFLPQCSNEIRNTMMEYVAQRNGQDIKDLIKSRDNPITKSEIQNSGTEAKRWASPLCAMPNDAGQMFNHLGGLHIENVIKFNENRLFESPTKRNDVGQIFQHMGIHTENAINYNEKRLSQIGTKTNIEGIDVTKERFVLVPVYEEEVVKRLTELFAVLHKAILIQRTWKKLQAKRPSNSTNKIGQQPVQKNMEVGKKGTGIGNGEHVAQKYEVLQNV